MSNESKERTGQLTRRQALTLAGGAAAALTLPWGSRAAQAQGQPAAAAAAPTTQFLADSKRFKIAGDDLFLLNRQKLKAFKVAQKAKLNGIQLDMGSMPGGKEFKTTLNDPAVRQQFLDAANASGVKIASMAWFAMYARQFPLLPMADELAASWVTTMQQMDVKLGFMPLMVKAKDATEDDIKNTWQRTVDIFKKVAPEAEKAGVVLGVEFDANADGYKKFLDAVGSPAVQAFYNPGVGLDNGFNVYEDLRALGKDRVCALHLEQGSVTMMKGDKAEVFERRLGNGLINFPLLRYVLDTMNWGGWMSIARSRLKGNTSPDTEMAANYAYLRTIFPE